MRLVGCEVHQLASRAGPASMVRPPVLETTCQSNGAVTCTVNVALRSGWSKQANIRLASAGSNCV